MIVASAIHDKSFRRAHNSLRARVGVRQLWSLQVKVPGRRDDVLRCGV